MNKVGANLEKTDMNITLQSTNINRFWINGGLGVGTLGIAGIVSASYQFLGSNLLSLRGTGTGEIFGDDFWDIGLLYGRATIAQDYFHASISAGMAVMGGSRVTGGLFSDTPREEISPQFGFPIEGQLFWHSRFFGLGLSGFANINVERSFAGLAASLQVGKLK